MALQIANQPLISVIIPVYNVEQYLKCCLDSVVSQTYRKLEIVLVDDGSTDKSSSICDEYAHLDDRVRVIHKENGGLSDARNTGVRKSMGSMVSFIDSDDIVSPVFIQVLYEAMVEHDCSMVALAGSQSFVDGEIPSLTMARDEVGKSQLIEPQDYLKRVLYQDCATGAPFRLYTRELIESCPFPSGVYYEDTGIVVSVVNQANRIGLIKSRKLYGYRLRDSGIVRQNYSPIKAKSAIHITRQIFSEVREWFPRLTNAAASRCFSINRMVFAQIPGLKNPDCEMVWNELVRYRAHIVLDRDARKRERIAACISYLGKGAFFYFCKVCQAIGLMV